MTLWQLTAFHKAQRARLGTSIVAGLMAITCAPPDEPAATDDERAACQGAKCDELDGDDDLEALTTKTTVALSNYEVADIDGHWAEPFLRQLASRSLLLGFADSTFRPNAAITQAQLAALLARGFSALDPGGGDEPLSGIEASHWAYAAVQKARRIGFFLGNRFEPDKGLTKLEVIEALSRGLGLGLKCPVDSCWILKLQFNDSASIPAASRNLVYEAMINDWLVNALDVTLLKPQKKTTRAEVAAMFYRALVFASDLPVVSSAYSVNIQKVDPKQNLYVAEPYYTPFDFCPAATGLQLDNARWLAYFSANEYSHFKNIGVAIEQFGFGDPGEGAAWRAAGNALEYLRQIAFVDDPETDPWIPRSTVAKYEQGLVQTAIQGKKIQFFSGGKIDSANQRFSEGSIQAVWAEHRTLPLVVIAFRGTEAEKMEDLLTDADLLTTALPGWGKVHSGFKKGFDSLVDKSGKHLLVEKLRLLSGTGKKVWLTGHSLGAAIATLTAQKIMDLNEKEGLQIRLGGVYTFGSPRVGNQEFASVFAAAAKRANVSVYRFSHGCDIVTAIPKFFYEHTGNLVQLDADGALEVNPARPDERCESTGATRWIKDHDMQTGYYDRVAEHRVQDPYARYTDCP